MGAGGQRQTAQKRVQAASRAAACRGGVGEWVGLAVGAGRAEREVQLERPARRGTLQPHYTPTPHPTPHLYTPQDQHIAPHPTPTRPAPTHRPTPTPTPTQNISTRPHTDLVMKAAAPSPKGARMPRARQADRSSSSVRFSRPSFSIS